MASLSFRLLSRDEGRTELGESPVWDAPTGDIWWVDISGKKLLRLSGRTGRVESWQTPEIPGFVVLMASDKPAVGMQSGVFAFKPANAAFELLVDFGQSGCRFNDATVDRAGRLWTSTMDLDAKPGAAAIQIVTGTLTLATIVEGLTIPNGMAVDPGRARLYYSDSHPDMQCIWHRHLAPGSTETGEPSVFAATTELDGRPDGAALDDRGYYWIAGVDGGALYVFDPEGRLDTTIPVPFPAPTKPAFFGKSGRAITVTSKNIGEEGGRLAFTDLPEGYASGITQPYWNAGAH